jgi:hypothetical protein
MKVTLLLAFLILLGSEIQAQTGNASNGNTPVFTGAAPSGNSANGDGGDGATFTGGENSSGQGMQIEGLFSLPVNLVQGAVGGVVGVAIFGAISNGSAGGLGGCIGTGSGAIIDGVVGGAITGFGPH